MKVDLRLVAPKDDEFLLSVYTASRAYELALVPWTVEQKADFVKQQFVAQQQHYATYYQGAVFNVITVDELPVGRLYVYRGKEEIRIIDIAILPQHRNQGIGKPLIQALLDEARVAGKRVRIHVEVFNPLSVQLFGRLGFNIIDNDGINYLMEWTPPQ